ncbi:4662_t:CDS:1 [Funneliformis geosporum]|uniref:4662_t:CDS:1 n=1 Tax=Funneliformis geosporum TaxID=1117311 RepID=A0A9W4SFM5_9GLOM|nr:4662_t:CDS:1 [Funneliformis geosporum]
MNKTNSAGKQMFLHLPPEILGKILLLTSLQTRTMILSSVCKSLKHFIFNHDILWSKLNLNPLKNISNSTISNIFYCNIPNDTKNFIRELLVNDININKHGLKIILKTCVNLRSLHLRTYKDNMNMKIFKELLEELYSDKEQQEDVQEKEENEKNQQTVGKPICNLTTIYWHVGHNFEDWWAPSMKDSLEFLLKKLSNNSKAAIKVPWCDVCNQQKASMKLMCYGDLHEKNWSIYGCFECADYGNTQADFKCDECLKTEKLKDELAISALESLTQTDDNPGSSSNIVEEIIRLMDESDDEAENAVVSEE